MLKQIQFVSSCENAACCLDGYACNVDVGNLMHNEGGIFLEVGGGSTSRLRAPPVTPVSVRTTEDASSLASRSALVPPTIIQTAATPPSMYRSIASDVDFHMDNCYNLNLVGNHLYLLSFFSAPHHSQFFRKSSENCTTKQTKNLTKNFYYFPSIFHKKKENI